MNTQRVYFIDEAHRSYNPEGSFLANLIQSDPNAIIISLTGTPILRKGEKRVRVASKEIFGDYIHKYYYNQSIADGYTLRLIREEIETEYGNYFMDYYFELNKEIEILENQEVLLKQLINNQNDK